MWRGILLGTDPRYRDSHALLRRLPGAPRCYMCSAPFKGAGAVVARRMGRHPWAKNPHYCSACFEVLEQQHGGAEVECSLFFADIRGSTSLAENMSPTEFRQILDRFYDAAAKVLHEHEAILDKFVGDEAVAIFIPALSGDQHASRAVAAGRALLRATGYGTPAARGCRSASASTQGSRSSAPSARARAPASRRSAISSTSRRGSRRPRGPASCS